MVTLNEVNRYLREMYRGMAEVAAKGGDPLAYGIGQFIDIPTDEEEDKDDDTE